MRYRLMASYLGASYQAAVGPSDRDVTLFAAPPPPEEHGFSPVPGGGIWRKQVRLDDLDGLWESRPIGSYHGEPCLVLDDLGDRLHIVYLGMDERRAGQLGYWQVDRGVFEVVVQRHEVTDLAEERHEFPIALLLSALPRASASPRALNAGDGGAGSGPGSSLGPGSGSRAGAGAGNGGNAAGRMALASGGQGPSAQGPRRGQGASQRASAQRRTGRRRRAGGRRRDRGVERPARPPPGLTSCLRPDRSSCSRPGSSQWHRLCRRRCHSRECRRRARRRRRPSPRRACPRRPARHPVRPQVPVATQQFSGGTQVPAAQQAFTAQTAAAQSGTAQPGAAQPRWGPRNHSRARATEHGTTCDGAVGHGAARDGAAVLRKHHDAHRAAGSGRPVAERAARERAAAAAVVAWHGSPVPDGNGTWYYQPNVDPQTAGGTTQNGISQNGISQNVGPEPRDAERDLAERRHTEPRHAERGHAERGHAERARGRRIRTGRAGHAGGGAVQRADPNPAVRSAGTGSGIPADPAAPAAPTAPAGRSRAAATRPACRAADAPVPASDSRDHPAGGRGDDRDDRGNGAPRSTSACRFPARFRWRRHPPPYRRHPWRRLRWPPRWPRRRVARVTRATRAADRFTAGNPLDRSAPARRPHPRRHRRPSRRRHRPRSTSRRAPARRARWAG